MRKHLPLSIVFSLVFIWSSLLRAQSPLFGRSDGSPTNDYADCIATDHDGNVLIAGEYSGNAKFGQITLESKGHFNAFVTKYDNSGNIIWAQRIASATTLDADIYTNAIVVDRENNIYIAGTFIANADFDQTSIASMGSSDMFIEKLTPDGARTWLKVFGDDGTGNWGLDAINAMALDPSGDLIVTGTYNHRLLLDTIELTSTNNRELFVAKLDPQGHAKWAVSASTASASHQPAAIAIDSGGNCYVTGSFFQDMTLGPDTYHAVDAEQKIFLAKISSEGNVVWAEKAGSGGYYGSGNGIAIDQQDHLYVAGFFRAGLDLDTVHLGYYNGLHYAALVLKYDTAGHFIWARQSTGSDQHTTLAQVRVDAAGSPIIVGSHNNPVQLGTLSLTPSTPSLDAFTTKLSSSGEFLWAKSVTGAKNEHLTSLAIAGDEAIFVAGTSDSAWQCGSISSASSGGSDIILIKLEEAQQSVRSTNDRTPAILYTNPVHDVMLLECLTTPESSTLDIYSQCGVKLLSTPFTQKCDISSLSAGSYYLSLAGRAYKFIKLH